MPCQVCICSNLFNIHNLTLRLTVLDGKTFTLKGVHTCPTLQSIVSNRINIELEMQELTDNLAIRDYSLTPHLIADDVYYKMMEKHGNVALVGLSKDQVINRVKYTRSQLSGGDSIRTIELPQLSTVSAEDVRYGFLETLFILNNYINFSSKYNFS